MMCRMFSFSVYVLKLETAYELSISDWSSDVCSSDLCRSTVCPLFPIRERRMTEIKHEQRSFVVPVELRAKGDSGQKIAGYAAIFGETADIGGYFLESIVIGAFAV